MFFASNIKFIRESLNLSQSDFALRLKVKRTTLAGYESGRSYPDFLTFVAISEELRVSPSEFIHQDLRIQSLTNNSTSITSSAITNSKPINQVFVTLDNSGKENIVFVNVKAAAGYPSNINNAEFYSDLPTFSLPGSRYQNGTFRCFEVTGESMKGSFKQGDWCIGRLIIDLQTIRDNYVYVIVTNESVLIKRVINRLKDRESLVLKSDNPEYSHIQIHADDIKEVWLGVGKFTWDLSSQDFDILKTMDDLYLDFQDLKQRVSKIESNSMNKMH